MLAVAAGESASAAAWRYIRFFDPVADDVLPDWLHHAHVTASVGGFGFVFFGTADGEIIVANTQLKQQFALAEYEGRVTHMALVAAKQTLVVLGEDVTGTPVLRTYVLTLPRVASDPAGDAPSLAASLTSTSTVLAAGATSTELVPSTELKLALLKSAHVQVGPHVVAATAMAVLQNLTQIAIGLENGTIIMFRGDLTKDRASKPKVIFEGSEPITYLGFASSPSKPPGSTLGLGLVGVASIPVLLYVVTRSGITLIKSTSSSNETQVVEAAAPGIYGAAVMVPMADRSLEKQAFPATAKPTSISTAANAGGAGATKHPFGMPTPPTAQTSAAIRSSGEPTAAAMASGARAEDVLVAREHQLCCYGPSGRGPSYAVSVAHPPLQWIAGRFLAVVSCGDDCAVGAGSAASGTAPPRSHANASRSRPSAAARLAPARLIVYDLKNKFVVLEHTFEPRRTLDTATTPRFAQQAAQATLPSASSLASAAASVDFVVADRLLLAWSKRAGRWVSFSLVDLQQRLAVLCSNHLYNVAASMLESEAVYEAGPLAIDVPARLADLYRQYGDWLYSKGDFDGALQQYILTIDSPHVEPSYIITKWIQIHRIPHLARYLERLVFSKQMKPAIMTLLVNCLVKLKEQDKLMAILASLDDDVEIDLVAMFNVCRSGGYYDAARFLAEKYEQIELLMLVLTQDLGDYDGALEALGEQDLSVLEQGLQKYGPVLVSRATRSTVSILTQLCTESPHEDILPLNPHQFAHLFVDQQDACIDFLERVAAKRWCLNLAQPAATPEKRAAEDRRIVAHVASFPTDRLRDEDTKAQEMTFNTLAESYLNRLQNRERARASHSRLSVHASVDRLTLTAGKGEGIGDDDGGGAAPDTPPAGRLATEPTEAATAARRLPRDAKMERLLHSPARYDPYHLLILCRLYRYEPGLLFLYEFCGQMDNVLRLYVGSGEAAQALALCRRFGDEQPHLWLDALELLVRPETDAHGDGDESEHHDGDGDGDGDRDHADDGDHDAHRGPEGTVARATSMNGALTASPAPPRFSEDEVTLLRTVLEEIDRRRLLYPYQIISKLAQNPAITLDHIGPWLRDRLARDEAQHAALEAGMRQQQRDMADAEADLATLRQPVTFAAQTCERCRQAIELPYVYFLCRHSYHVRCLEAVGGGAASRAAGTAAMTSGAAGLSVAPDTASATLSPPSHLQPAPYTCPACAPLHAQLTQREQERALQLSGQQRHEAFKAAVQDAEKDKETFSVVVSYLGNVGLSLPASAS